jgi:Casein kinase II regulatory subunit
MRRVCVIFWTSINLVKGRKLSTSLLRSSKQQKKNVREKEREVCWVQKFCAAPGHEFYSEIPLSFIRDPVTTATICDSIDSPYVEYAIKFLNRETFHVSEKFGKAEEKAINAVAEELYNLLHGRYVLTDEGLKSVRAKYDDGVYGQCLRVFCRGHPLLPVGLHDRQKESTVKCFCPKMQGYLQSSNNAKQKYRWSCLRHVATSSHVATDAGIGYNSTERLLCTSSLRL